MTRIISTVGPFSSNKNLNYLIQNSEIIRFNLSHNTLMWHKKNIGIVKKIDSNKYILIDIPGAKPRTLNDKEIFIKKGEKISFVYNSKTKNNKSIRISNPLPRLNKKNIKYFSVSDGNYLFKLKKLNKEKLLGESCQNFILKPKKGLNIPYSIYNDKFQAKVYKKSIKKINNFKFDCVGLSFVQNSKIIKTLKKAHKNKIFVSKIENFLGYINRKEIIQASDVIMIDRGDLAAEVGNEKLTDYVNNIIEDCKFFAKPIILATENLNSFINQSTPSKSDILNLDYYINKKVDFIMLSDETATSKNWKNILKWLNRYLRSKIKPYKKIEKIDVIKILKEIKNQVLVIFSKKGYVLDRFNGQSYTNLVLFTENRDLARTYHLKENINSFFTKFTKKNIDNFIYKNIKMKKNLIFKNNETAILIKILFPRKKSRINSLTVITKKDFV